MSKIDLKNFSDGLIQLFDYVAKNPFIKLLDVVVKIALLAAIALSIINYKEIIKIGYDIIVQVEDDNHSRLMNHRLEIDSEMNDILKELCDKTGADAAFIFEFHNGSNNLSGLPFFYMDMTYEHISADDKPLYGVNAWKNIPIAGYPFITNYYKEGFFIGSVDDIEAEDKALKYKLLSQGTEKIGVMIMHGQKHPIGVIGISSGTNFTKCNAEIESLLIKYTQRVLLKLDAQVIK